MSAIETVLPVQHEEREATDAISLYLLHVGAHSTALLTRHKRLTRSGPLEPDLGRKVHKFFDAPKAPSFRPVSSKQMLLHLLLSALCLREAEKLVSLERVADHYSVDAAFSAHSSVHLGEVPVRRCELRL